MLIKEGKINFKYILIVIILAILVGGGTLGYTWWIEKQETPEIANLLKEKAQEKEEPTLEIQELEIKWKGQLECGEVIDWVRIIDIDNDKKNELIISCAPAEKLTILKWQDNGFVVEGELPKEIVLNEWNSYILQPNDFGSIYFPDKKEFNMIYSPAGGVPWKEGDEETIWVRLDTFEWDNINKQLQFRIRNSILGGPAWYLGDINNDSREDLIFFSKPDLENWEDFSIRVLYWDGEEFVFLGSFDIKDWRMIHSGVQPWWAFRRFVLVADTNNNGTKEIILLDEVGIRYIKYAYLGLEWDGENFNEFRLDEKIEGRYSKYKIKGVGDFDGDGKNELIARGISEAKESLEESFNLSILRWVEEKNVYEETLVRIFSGYNFIEMGDIDNNSVEELMFQDKEGNFILLSKE